MSNGTSTAKKSSRKESKTASSMKPQSSETLTSSSSPVQLESTRDLSMWLRQAFPANHSALQERKEAKTTKGTSGRKRSNVFASYDPDTRSWRTSQVCLILDTSAKSSLRWPKSGSMRDGLCSEQTTWAPRTDASGSGSWPTPTVNGNYNRKGLSKTSGDGLATAVKMCKTPSAADAYTGNMKKKEFNFGNSGSLAQEVESGFLETHRKWPTPAAHEGRLGYQRRDTGKKGTQKSLSTEVIDDAGGRTAVTGQLNPTWVEWLMGWPLGWTDLKPLETDKYQQWLQQHGCC